MREQRSRPTVLDRACGVAQPLLGRLQLGQQRDVLPPKGNWPTNRWPITSGSGHASANARIYLRFDCEKPRISGNSARKSASIQLRILVPQPALSAAPRCRARSASTTASSPCSTASAACCCAARMRNFTSAIHSTYPDGVPTTWRFTGHVHARCSQYSPRTIVQAALAQLPSARGYALAGRASASSSLPRATGPSRAAGSIPSSSTPSSVHSLSPTGRCPPCSRPLR